MIERYSLFTPDAIKPRFGTANTILGNFKKRYNASPAQLMPVILTAETETKIAFMNWGFLSQNAKDNNSIFRYKTYTVREEDVFKKVSYEKAIRSQRCLVPTNGFYLWKSVPGGKVPYFLHLPEYAPFSLAGIYSSYTTPEGKEQGMFTIVTTESNLAIGAIADRAPVILTPEQEATWLASDVSDMTTLYSLLTPYDGPALQADVVSEAVFNKKANTPQLIAPVRA